MRWRERSSWTTTAASVPASTSTPTSTWWWGRPGNSELFYNYSRHQASVFCPYRMPGIQCAYLMCQFVWLSSHGTDRPIYIVIFNLLICSHLIDSSLYNYQHLGISSEILPSDSRSEIILIESLPFCHNLHSLHLNNTLLSLILHNIYYYIMFPYNVRILLCLYCVILTISNIPHATTEYRILSSPMLTL